MARYATRYYANIARGDMRCVLVEATDRILPEVGEDLGRYTVEQLRKRSIDVRLEHPARVLRGRARRASDGDEFDADTIVWTAGVKANPVLAAHRPAAGRQGPGQVRYANLRVEGVDRRLGRRRQRRRPRPDRETRRVLRPERPARGAPGEAARRQHRPGASTGEPPQDYEHKYVGSVASLGLHKGVAQVYGVKLRGFPAWFMHRTYHVSRVPTFNRKVRVVLDWTLALFFRREVVSLGSLHHPREEFDRANQ